MRFNHIYLNALLKAEKEDGISVAAIGRKTGLPIPGIHMLKNGITKNPAFITVIKLVRYFKCNFEDFILEE